MKTLFLRTLFFRKNYTDTPKFLLKRLFFGANYTDSPVFFEIVHDTVFLLCLHFTGTPYRGKCCNEFLGFQGCRCHVFFKIKGVNVWV